MSWFIIEFILFRIELCVIGSSFKKKIINSLYLVKNINWREFYSIRNSWEKVGKLIVYIESYIRVYYIL